MESLRRLESGPLACLKSLRVWVKPLILQGDSEVLERCPISVAVDRAQVQHCLSAGHFPTHAGSFHTVFDDVAFGPLNMGLGMESVRRQVERALEMVGLKGFEGRSAHHLSEGEKKRVALATVLSMNSEILVFDEPTDNLDPAGSRLLVERIQSITQTKVIVTHHLAVAVDLCKRAILLWEGRKVEDLPMEELLRNRTLLVQFGFYPDFAQWMCDRRKNSERISN